MQDQVDNESITHPLQSPWALWFELITQSNYNLVQNWEEKIKKVVTVSTVEDFWGVLNNIPFPSKIQTSNYYFFRAGINPVWEDKVFEKGGASLEFALKDKQLDKQDNIFKYVLLSAIGETLESSNLQDINYVAGVRIQMRKQIFKLSVWVTDIKEKEAVLLISKNLEQTIQQLLNDVPEIFISSFDQSIKNLAINQF
eukprot:TRINITY_DN5198_c0_g1_i1.p1 TRINITY_DN5198_c0_g1~~TRINITY_DN5198_c0_g1_i1.p1  ORF type:complete len:198 (+),score=45.90 TRINITY_DN5198_c0_g1_i1:101-694(+)